MRLNLSCGSCCRQISVGSLFLLAMLSFVARTQASDLPQATVKAALAAAKEQGSIVAMLSFIHWDSVFAEAKVKQELPDGLESAAALRQYYELMLTNPKTLFLEKYSQPPKAVPAVRHGAYRQHVLNAATELEGRIKSANLKLGEVDYRVGDSRVRGDRAEVDVTAIMQGKKSKRTWGLVRIDGKWYLPSVRMADAW